MALKQLVKKIITLFLLGSVALGIGSSTGSKNSAAYSVGGEEYGTNEHGGWR